MSSAPYMPFFCGDYLKDTTDLGLEEHGAYLMILINTWAKGGKPLPDDDARMAKRLGVTKDRWAKRLKPVLAPFFDLSGGTWRNERLEAEWDHAQKKIAARREAGEKGGRSRRTGPENGPSSPSPTRENFAQNGDANQRENNETAKAKASDLLKQNGSTHTQASSNEEESKGSLCESLESTPREAHTQAPPVSSETKSAAGSNVVPFVPPGSREALPVGWVLPDEWRAWAQEAGQSGIDSAARRFAMHWRGRGVKSAAEWREAWEVWVTENIERGYGNGAGRNTDQRRGHGDLAAVVKSDLPGWFGYAEGGSNPW
jgi:uncharacterized protein YdaU (DUF1376 family)